MEAEPDEVYDPEMEANVREFKLKFDPKKTEVAKILAALETAGEAATKMD